MSVTSELIKELREEAEYQKDIKDYHEMAELLAEAADTIEALSAKPQAANMDNGGGWIPCEDSKNIPKEKQLIWVSVEYKTGSTESIEGIFIDGQPCRMNGVGLGLIAKAWMPRYIPEAYRP